jgi:hypothetical protein
LTDPADDSAVTISPVFLIPTSALQDLSWDSGDSVGDSQFIYSEKRSAPVTTYSFDFIFRKN